MKTFEDCCNEVAKKKGYSNWECLLEDHHERNFDYRKIIKLQKEAAELYRFEGIKEAFRMARIKLGIGDFRRYAYNEEDGIINILKNDNKA